MGYNQTSPRRTSGQRRKMLRHEKDRSKVVGQKHRSTGSYVFEEKHVPSLEEIAEKTFNRLRILGKQKFALPPFSMHFNRWLVNLREVLSEFESSPAVSLDDEFANERSRILSNIQLDLEERRRKESSGSESAKGLSDKRILLKHVEKEYAVKTRDLEKRKDCEIKHLSNNIDGLKKELDHISKIKAGIFRVVSKKAKAQKETEATQRLNDAQRELEKTLQNFTVEQGKIRKEYESKLQWVTEQIRSYQKEVEDQEIDGSAKARRVACESLAEAVSALLQRKNLKPS